MGGLPQSPVPGVLRLPPGELREGPEPAGARPGQGHHRGQLPGLVRLPPRQRGTSRTPGQKQNQNQRYLFYIKSTILRLSSSTHIAATKQDKVNEDKSK